LVCAARGEAAAAIAAAVQRSREKNIERLRSIYMACDGSRNVIAESARALLPKTADRGWQTTD